MCPLHRALVLLASAALYIAASAASADMEGLSVAQERYLYIGAGGGGGLLIVAVIVLLAAVCCLKAKLARIQRQTHSKQEENNTIKPDDEEQSAFDNPTYSNDDSAGSQSTGKEKQIEAMYAVVEGPQVEENTQGQVKQPAKRRSVTFNDMNYDYVTHDHRTQPSNTTVGPNYCEVSLEKVNDSVAKTPSASHLQHPQSKEGATQEYAMPSKKKVKQDMKPQEYNRLWQISSTEQSSKRLSVEAVDQHQAQHAKAALRERARPSSDEVQGETSFHSPPLPPPLRLEDMQFSPTRIIKSQEHMLNPLGGHYDVPRKIQCHASCDGLYCNSRMQALSQHSASTAGVLPEDASLPLYGNIGN